MTTIPTRLKDFLAERHKEFEEEFPDGLYTIYHYGESGEFAQENDATKDLLSFHDQSVLMALEKVREEVEKLATEDSRADSTYGGGKPKMIYRNSVLSRLSSAISEIKGNER